MSFTCAVPSYRGKKVHGACKYMKMHEQMKQMKILFLEKKNIRFLEMFDDLGALDYFIRNLWKQLVNSPGRTLFPDFFIFENLKMCPTNMFFASKRNPTDPQSMECISNIKNS